MEDGEWGCSFPGDALGDVLITAGDATDVPDAAGCNFIRPDWD